MKDPVKIVICLLFLLVTILPTDVSAAELEEGMPFLAARKLLIHKGWCPIRMKEKVFPYREMEKKFKKARIGEVESCAMDRPLCIFNYKKNDKCLRLITEGEEMKDMRVFHWTYQCPDAD